VNRRSFLGTAAAALVLRREPRRSQPSALGIEVSMYDDATLRTIAGIGYRDVVLDDLYAVERPALDRAGLSASAVHVTTPLLYRGIDRHLATAHALGCRYFVCGHLDPEEHRTQQDWHELAALFNRAGDTARKAGLRLGYRIQGDEVDLMLAETDPALVWFESTDTARVGKRCFAVDVSDTATADQLRAAKSGGVEHYYVQAKSVDGARASYGLLARQI
jgi:sugar phosphate isomerase/epimerase